MHVFRMTVPKFHELTHINNDQKIKYDMLNMAKLMA